MNESGPSSPPSVSSSEPSGPTEETKHLAYAEASLMLIECLIMALMENGVVTGAQMVKVVESALATKRQMVKDRDHPEIAAVAAGILSSLANSLAATKARVQSR